MKFTLFNEETSSGNFIDKSTLCSFNLNFEYILAVRDSSKIRLAHSYKIDYLNQFLSMNDFLDQFLCLESRV